MPGRKARTMRLLTADKRVEIIAHLVECTSIRATARICKVDKNTVMALLAAIGAGCLRIHSQLVRDLAITRVECDEIQAAMHTREPNVKRHDPAHYGHFWTYTAFATVSKLLIAFAHGKRTQALTDAFMWDLRRRLTVIPELVTDGLVLYEAGVARSFGLAVDYSILIKTPSKKGKKSTVPFIQKRRVVGLPDMDRVSTSFVERMNSTIRDQTKRFARRSRCHSKTVEGHTSQFALFACFYNLVRVHSSIGTAPAVAAGIIHEPWSLAQLVEEALCAEEAAPIDPQPLQPREGEHKVIRELPEGRGFLRLINGGKTKPGIVKVPGAPPLKRKRPLKRTRKPAKQLEFDFTPKEPA